MTAGWRVRGYVLEQQLGRGGSSEVWRARIAASGEKVALKRLLVPGAAQLQRAHAEAAKLTVLEHPHLVRLHALLPDGDAAAVLVLDLADGGSLADLLTVRGRLSAGEVITALAPVAAALAYLHGAGVVHGDVSAANILFSARGTALLSDLGVSRLTGEESDAESTPAYVDPIVAQGEFPSPSSDVFMLGAVALHALVGDPLWQGTTADEVLARARAGDLGSVGNRLEAAGVDAEMTEVVRRALHPDPLHRGSAADLALDLRHSGTPVAVELTAGRTRPEPPLGEPVPPSPAETHPRAGARHAAVPAGPSSTRLPWRRPAEDEPDVEHGSVAVVDAGRPAFARPRTPDPGPDAPTPTGQPATLQTPGRGAPPPTSAVHPPPRPAIPVPRRRPRRRLVGALGVVLAVLVAAVVLVLTGAPSGGEPATRASRAPTPAAARPTATSPVRRGAAPAPPRSIRGGTPTAWAARLHALDTTRARAFATRDTTALRSVYASAALLAADSAQLRRIVPAHCRLTGATSSYSQVRASRAGRSTVVTATVAQASARLVCGGAVRGVAPAVPATPMRIVLVPAAGSWRIADLSRAG